VGSGAPNTIALKLFVKIDEMGHSAGGWAKWITGAFRSMEGFMFLLIFCLKGCIVQKIIGVSTSRLHAMLEGRKYEPCVDYASQQAAQGWHALPAMDLFINA
jgi:hypothetical protein